MDTSAEKSIIETALVALNESLKSLPTNTIEKFIYLWKSSHQLVLTSFDISHNMMRDFVQLARSHNVNIPSIVMHQICQHCCCIQILGLSCRSKIVNRKRRGKANSIDANQFDVSINKRYKKTLVRLCLICNTKTTEPCNPVAKRKSTNQPMVNNSLNKSLTSTPTKFSFLDKFCGKNSIKKDGLCGDFISFSNSTSLSSSTLLSKTPDKKRRYSDSAANTNTSDGMINLVELERSLKKQKRASKGGNTPITTVENIKHIGEMKNVKNHTDDFNVHTKNQIISRNISENDSNSKLITNSSSRNSGSSYSSNLNNRDKQINTPATVAYASNLKSQFKSNKPSIVQTKPTAASTASLSNLQSLFRK